MTLSKTRLPERERPHRPIYSFGRRRGRKLRDAKQEAVDILLPKLGITLPEKGGICPPSDFFTQDFADYWLEIGFGNGEHLLAKAQQNSNVGLIGCEPYVNGFGNLLMQLDEHPADNIRLFTDDARLLLPHLPDACLGRVYILFPDPWPKVRHHKRRLVQQPFLDALARVMKPRGTLLLATDHEGYLTWMLEQMLASPHFHWTAQAQADWLTPPEGWVKTRYQQKAEAEGRGAHFLRFARV